MAALLTVEDLTVRFHTPAGPATAVDGAGFAVAPGEIFGIVGESGCGKSATCRAILRVFGAARAEVAGGRILLDGVGELRGMSERDLSQVRGRDVAFIFQDPLTALNPTMRIGDQIAEVIRRHRGLGRAAARAQALEVLRDVQVPAAERRLDAWPHELSGGLRQRVMIAMALALRPRLIIADEPTTALDVTVQDQVLRLLLARRDADGVAIVLVTHDLGVVAEVCDRVAVMYAGRIVETAPTFELLDRPRHPYTRALLSALPSNARPGERLVPIPGSPPPALSPPPGCRFAPRCARARPACTAALPGLAPRPDGPAGHLDACIEGR